MAASLFHDVGYDIEKSYEEELFRKKRNTFWGFMTKRNVDENPLEFKGNGPARRLIRDFLLTRVNCILGNDDLDIVDFQAMFQRRNSNNTEWYQYDHGLISAVKYLVELEKLQHEQTNLIIMNWEPNQIAALAMALHNFRHYSINLRLTINEFETVIPYLLMVSDEIQEWERERSDNDDMTDGNQEGINLIKERQLSGIIFRKKYCYLIVNHILKTNSQIDDYKNFLLNKINNQKKHYPIELLLPQPQIEIYNKYKKQNIPELISEYNTYRNTITHSNNYVPISRASLVIARRLIEETTIYQKIEEILETQTEKQIIAPNNPAKYEILLEHHINGEPFITVSFPL